MAHARKKTHGKGFLALGVALALALAALGLTLTACGSSGDDGSSAAAGSSSDSTQQTAEKTADGLDKITVQSLWFAQGQFAGLYTADAKGFYKDEGIDVDILPGGSDVSSEDQVENDVAQVGVAFYSSVLTYQEGGSDFINVFQTFKRSPQYLVAKKSSGISTPADLKGKKVGSWFGGRQYELYALASLNGLDPTTDIDWVQQDYTLDQFNSDQIDVASAMSYNEYPLLVDQYGADNLNVFDMNDLGSAMLEDCLFVKRSWAEQNSDLLVRFLRATIKGWAYAQAHPEEAAQIVTDAGEGNEYDHQLNMVNEVNKLVVPDGDTTAQIGELDDDALQQTIDLGYQTGLISSKPDLSTSVDSSYRDQAAATVDLSGI